MSYIGKTGYYFREFGNMCLLSEDGGFIPMVFVGLLPGKFFYEQT